MADLSRYVDTGAAAGGDGTTNAVAGANCAYQSLAQWEAAEDQDLTAGGGNTMTVYCARTNGGGADTTQVAVNDWTTSDTCTLTIAQSDFPTTGVLDATKYILDCSPGSTNTYCLGISEDYVTVRNLQVRVTATAASRYGITISGQSVANRVNVYGCIIAAVYTSSGAGHGVRVVSANSIVYVANTVVRDFINGSASANGIAATDNAGSTVYVYNCTVTNCYRGIWRYHGTFTVTNCVCFNNYDDFTIQAGTGMTITNCASDDKDGTKPIDISPNGTEATDWARCFVDYVNGDYRLKSSASVPWKGGIAISGVTTDILGTTRHATTPCVGAFEYVIDSPTTVEGWLSGWKYRKKIAIDHNVIAADVTNIPLVISAYNTGLFGDKANADLSDVRFTQSDGTTVIVPDKIKRKSTTSLLASKANATGWLQGVSFDADSSQATYNYFITAKGAAYPGVIYKYNQADEQQASNTDLSAHCTQIADCCYKDGYLYVADATVANDPSSTGPRVVRFSASDLTYDSVVCNEELANYFTEGVVFFGGYWWTSCSRITLDEETIEPLRIAKYDTSWNLVKMYTMDDADVEPDQDGQGLAFFTQNGQTYMVTSTHDDTEVTPDYVYPGSLNFRRYVSATDSWEFVGRIEAGTINASIDTGQGMHMESTLDGTVLWCTDRPYGYIRKVNISEFLADNRTMFYLNVPTVASASNSVICMYYGKSDATDNSDSTVPWDTSCVGVWHGQDGATAATLKESTSNANTATKGHSTGATNSLEAEGLNGPCQTYTLANQHYAYVSDSPFDFTTQDLSLSCWVQLAALTTNQHFISKIEAGGYGIQFSSSDTNKIITAFYDTGGTAGYRKALSDNSAVAGRWYHVLGQRIAATNEVNVWLNGVKQSTTAEILADDINTTNVPLCLGANPNAANYSEWLGGKLWGCRVETSLRSADWWYLTWANGRIPNGGLLFGSEESVYAGSGSASVATVTASAEGTYTDPVYEATGSGTCTKATASASATFTAPVYAATGSASVTKATASASGTYAVPVYAATGSASFRKATASASGTFVAPVYAATGSATATKATASASATYAVPVYEATGSANCTKATANAEGTFAVPVYEGDATASFSKPTASASGEYTQVVYAGDGSATVTKATASASATYAVPVYAATGSATCTKATALADGTFTVPVYAATGSATCTKATALADGTFTVPVYAATGSATCTKATASASGEYTQVVYAGEGVGTVTKSTASASATYTVPVYEAEDTVVAPKATANAEGTYTQVVYAGEGSASFRKVTASAIGVYGTALYQGSGAGTATKATASASATFTVPTYEAEGSALAEKATASAEGTFTVPVYAATGSASVRKATAVAIGVYGAAIYQGSGSITVTKAQADANGTFTVPVYASSGTGIFRKGTATSVGSFTAPVYMATGNASVRKATAAASGLFGTIYTGSGSAEIQKCLAFAEGTFVEGSVMLAATWFLTLKRRT